MLTAGRYPRTFVEARGLQIAGASEFLGFDELCAGFDGLVVTGRVACSAGGQDANPNQESAVFAVMVQ